MKHRVLALLAVSSLFSSTLFAASHIWTGAANGAFSNPANWIGGSPAGDAAADLTFPVGAPVMTLTNDIAGLTVHSILFRGSGYSIAGNAITFASATITDSSLGWNTIATDIVLAGTSTITTNGTIYLNNELSLNGTISGTGGVTIDGGGRTIFGGTAANTYSGTTSVVDGQLRLSKPANVNAIGGRLVLGTAGIYRYGSVYLAAAEQIPNDAGVTVCESCEIRTNGNDETFGPLILKPGATINTGFGSARIILGADIVVADGEGSNNINLYGLVYLPASRTISGKSRLKTFSATNISAAPGATLTVRGGNVDLAGDWTGPTIVNDSGAHIRNPKSAVIANGGYISGQAASLVSNGATVGPFSAAGDIHLDGRSVVTFQTYPLPSITAGGVLDLAGAMSFDAYYTREPGKSYLLMSNAGPGAVRGTFNATPEGATLNGGSLRITYAGGDGNDVVLTDISRVFTGITTDVSNGTQVPAATSLTINATVAGYAPGKPLPTGSLTFHEGTTTLAVVPLSAGKASLAIGTLTPGLHTITIDYPGDAVWAPSTVDVRLSVLHPVPEITSLSPSSAKGGKAVTFSIFGRNFVDGCVVYERNFGIPSQFISSTELRATLDLTFHNVAGTTSISVSNPGPGVLNSNALPFEILAPDVPSGSGLTVGTNYAEANVTPSATTAWMSVLYENAKRLYHTSYNVLTDSDGDGMVRLNYDFPYQTGEIGVVDMATGKVIVDGPLGAGRELPFPDDAFDLGPNGKLSRLTLRQSRSYILWVRRGSGAWFLYGPDGGTADADRLRNGTFTALTSQMQRIDDSPEPPDRFDAGDVLLVIDEETFSWFGGTIGSRLHASTAATTLDVGGDGVALEGSPLHFTILRAGRSDGVTTVHYATKDGTAVPGLDYQAVSGDVTFNPGEFAKTFTLPTVNDAVYAGARDLSFTISDAAGAAIHTASINALIWENDPLPAINGTTVTVQEGGPGTHTVQIPFTLTGATRVGASLMWQLGFSPAPGNFGKLVFAPGETSKSVEVHYDGDDVPGPDFTIEVITSSANGATAPKSPPQLKIIDDDQPRLSINDVVVKEGDSGPATATLDVTMSSAATKQITVSYATADGSATATGDYTAASGTLTFAPGELKKTINVNVTGDTNKEPNEIFVVSLSNPVNASLGRSAGAVSILDDDNGELPSLSIGDARVREQDYSDAPPPAGFVVQLSFASATPVLVDYATTAATATPNVDYKTTNGTLTFAAGETQKFITVPIVGDFTPEPDETFRVTLTNPRGATITHADGTGTIADDDTPPPVPTLSIADVALSEGNQGTSVVTFTVTLSTAAPAVVTVSYATVDATAVSPVDYLGTSGELRFQPGERTKTISVNVNGDTLPEADESFAVVLLNAAGAKLDPSSASCVILNDDGAPPSTRGRPSRH